MMTKDICSKAENESHRLQVASQLLDVSLLLYAYMNALLLTFLIVSTSSAACDVRAGVCVCVADALSHAPGQ